MLCYRHKSNGCAPLFDIMKNCTHEVKGGTPMKTNRIAIIISFIALTVFCLVAGFIPVSAAAFDACILLASCAFAVLFYSVLHRAYQW